MTPFPPEDIRSFLACCAGEWLVLRSRFSLDRSDPPSAENAAGRSGEEAEAWHASERGELVVAYLEPEEGSEPGGLAITSPARGGSGRSTSRLRFSACGRFWSPDGEGSGADAIEGFWQLLPEGSLELTIRTRTTEVKERIWFTKPNLRLRSSVERRTDGKPDRASFSSEIRRVRPPLEPTGSPAA